MSLYRTFKLFTYLAAFWAFVTLAIFAELHAVPVILFLTFFFLGIFRGRFRIPISNAFWLLISVIVLLAALYGWFGIGERLYSVVYLFIYLEINKIWTEEKDRDTLQIYGLTFFQILAASVSTSSVFFAPALALYLFLILGALITFTLKRDAEASLDPRRLRLRMGNPDGPQPTPEEAQAIARLDDFLNRKFFTARFNRWLGATLCLVILIGSALFFIIPRLPGQSFLSSFTPRSAAQLTSGFNDSVEFSGMGEIQTDPTIAMRVIPRKGFPMNGGAPAIDVLRLRGTSLDYFDGRRWGKGSEIISNVSLPERFRTVSFRSDAAHQNPRGAFEVEIQLEPNRKGFLFGPDRTNTFAFERDSPFMQVDRASESVQTNIANWVTTLKYTTQANIPVDEWWNLGSNEEANPARHLFREFAKTWRIPDRGKIGVPLNTDLTTPYLQIPNVKDMETVRTLADEWTAGITAPREIATTLENTLKTRFTYSLNVDFSRLPDHLTRFLTVEKAGHCEYFATAMVMMLRAKGIPARIVNGYATDEWVQSGGGYYIVRQEHAHSWVEAYFANAGWMTFDPTPYDGIGANRIPMTVYRWMTRWVDRLKFAWYDNVIDYDVKDQTFMYHFMFRAADLVNPRGIMNFADDMQPKTLGQKRTFFLGVVTLGAVVLLIVMIREVRAYLRKRDGDQSEESLYEHHSTVIEDYNRLLQELSARFERPASQTPLEYAESVLKDAPVLSDFPPLTKRYYSARFRENVWGSEEQSRVNALLHLLRELESIPSDNSKAGNV